MLKSSLFSIFILLLCNSAFAQDKIYKRDGDVIDVKIKSVGIKTVTYLRFDNQSGPEYTIVKGEVARIVYQNGSEDDFSSMRPSRPMRSAHKRVIDADTDVIERAKYKPNIISVSPLQFSENGLGVGLSYERALDGKGIIAFYIPALVTFDLNNGTYLNQNTGNYQNAPIDVMFYAMPGIKVYPTGSYGLVRYSVGPSLVIGAGQKSATVYDPTYTYSTYETQSHVVLGMIINNSMSINPSPHISLGLELGMGFTYLNRIGGLNQGTEFLVQGGFKIGYRF